MDFGFRNNSLRYEYFITYGTMTTFGQSRIFTSCRNRYIGNNGMSFTLGNNFFLCLCANSLAFTDLVGNSNLGPETTPETVLASVDYTEKLSKLSGLPIFAYTAESQVAEALTGKLDPVIPLRLQEKYFDLPSQKPGNRPLWG